MSLIDQYIDLEKQIKERALYVNNLVADYTMDNHIDDDSYRVSWCNIADADYLELMYSGDTVVVEYDDGDGWPSQWQVPVRWLDMSDEEIIQDYLSELSKCIETDKLTAIQKLERQANELGFCLVKQ